MGRFSGVVVVSSLPCSFPLSKWYLREMLMTKISGCPVFCCHWVQVSNSVVLPDRKWNFNYVVMEVELPRRMRENYSSLLL